MLFLGCHQPSICTSEDEKSRVSKKFSFIRNMSSTIAGNGHYVETLSTSLWLLNRHMELSDHIFCSRALVQVISEHFLSMLI